MNGRTLSGGLHRGRRFEIKLVERAYAEVGGKHQNDQQNCREIPPGELRRSGTCNPIIMDISTTLHLGNGGSFCGSGENYLGKRCASPFLRKDENPLTHCRSSK